MSLSASIPVLKSQARRLKRLESLPLSEALNRVAQREGYASWSLLVTRAAARKDAELFSLLDPGELLLLGARPGHGKTLCALKVLVSAMRQGLPCWFFSLENDAPKLDTRFEALHERSSAFSKTFFFSHSDDICARYIIERTRGIVAERSVMAIDYLQLLDQRRESPELQEQVKDLRAFARRTGCIIIFISQIHHSFDGKAQPLPAADDVRLLNPLDLRLFDKALFLHEGRSGRLQATAALSPR